MNTTTLFIMSLITFLSLSLGIAAGVITTANMVKKKEENANRSQTGMRKPYKNKKKRKKVKSMEDEGVAIIDSSIAKDRLVISRALNNDTSQTEFNCLADGTDTMSQINRQRERSNNSYNILSNKLSTPVNQANLQSHALSANQLNNDAIANQIHQMYLSGQ